MTDRAWAARRIAGLARVSRKEIAGACAGEQEGESYGAARGLNRPGAMTAACFAVTRFDEMGTRHAC